MCLGSSALECHDAWTHSSEDSDATVAKRPTGAWRSSWTLENRHFSFLKECEGFECESTYIPMYTRTNAGTCANVGM